MSTRKRRLVTHAHTDAHMHASLLGEGGGCKEGLNKKRRTRRESQVGQSANSQRERERGGEGGRERSDGRTGWREAAERCARLYTPHPPPPNREAVLIHFLFCPCPLSCTREVSRVPIHTHTPHTRLTPPSNVRTRGRGKRMTG